MLNLDEILDKTVIKKISEEEIISQTKSFHNKLFENKYEEKLGKKNKAINNCDLIKDYSKLKKGLVIGYIKKRTKIFCEGRISEIIFINNQIQNIEIYNFILKIQQNISPKTHFLYLYNKFNKEDNQLQNYSYLENNLLLEKGQFIKYINKKRRNKVLCGGRIEKIKYDKDKKKIEELELYNFIANKRWKIKVGKYYVFVYDNIEKQINIMNKEKENILNLLNDINK